MKSAALQPTFGLTMEYGDPFNEEAIAAAVAKTIALTKEVPDLPLGDAVERAIREVICSCAVDVEDDIERGLSGLHASLADEIRRLAELQIGQSTPASRDAEVDEASRESFPASDPPGWIWEKPRH